MKIVQESREKVHANQKTLWAKILEKVPVETARVTNEAHFHINGRVTKQNFCYWAQNNPRKLHERPLFTFLLTVQCAVSNFGVIGPYLF